MTPPYPAKQQPAWNTQTKRTTPPNPSWKWGDTVDRTEAGKEWLEGIKHGYEIFNPDEMNDLSLISLMLSGLVPRPVALISTTSKDGVDNLAPFSYCTVVSHDPPLICFHGEARPRGIKDTTRNIRETEEFVVNIASDVWANQAHAASMECPPDQTEWGFSGLTKEPSALIKPPRVRESGVSYECVLHQIIPIMGKRNPGLSSEIVLGEVKRIHVRRDMLTTSPRAKLPQVDPTVLRPLARLGDISYASIGDVFRLPTLEWERDKHEAWDGEDKRTDLPPVPEGQVRHGRTQITTDWMSSVNGVV